MEIEHAEKLEPHILLSIANERLRLSCKNLEQLSDDLDLPIKQIERMMKQIHYHYQIENNQFTHD
ncbi:DUF4250 domain-containing protein [Endozoicomonas numazuensis]|uniref:DUF4250 domain-containing protein n=1 Tax=Endozoicomonas numazuensis TaxID=1137799 RepID=A0A081NIT0_9GAMM|nr:DUF4250 domain-containing protein [Endozoicomonas numazuensis]KEQ18353.1 hypothetical protein GZ78_12650 [Endozoicomonas numazuensis]